MIGDLLLLAASYAASVIFAAIGTGIGNIRGTTVLAAVFIIIYILANGEQYLYNVTMFKYPDRILRRRTGSFPLACIPTVLLLPLVTEKQSGYYLFLITAYLL